MLSCRNCQAMTLCPQYSETEIRSSIFMLVGAMLYLPIIDAIAKGISGEVQAGQIAWTRLSLQAIFLLPFVIKQKAFKVKYLWKHVARGILIALATVLFFSAIRVLPLADAISIFFIGPLILTVLSAIFLGETVGWRRILSVLVGFVGSLFIIRPSYSDFGLMALLPIGAAIAFAFYILLTRDLARDGNAGSAIAIQFYSGFFGAMAMSVVLTFGILTEMPVLIIVLPPAWVLGFMLLLGFVATTGHLFIVFAARRIDGSLIAPFQYVEIIGATAFGYLFFDEFPTMSTLVGIVIIVGSGLYIYHREKVRSSNRKLIS